VKILPDQVAGLATRSSSSVDGLLVALVRTESSLSLARRARASDGANWFPATHLRTSGSWSEARRA